ncbi:hypothetical protein [Empedobacter brevis]|nr:hypothetical protein [Empedobacter brevis]
MFVHAAKLINPVNSKKLVERIDELFEKDFLKFMNEIEMKNETN